MTTPQLQPSPPARYEELSREHLQKAADALENDDALQASEEIWGAVANALKAVAQQRGWNHRYHSHIRDIAYYLTEEWNRPELNVTFRSVQDLHTNFYEHQEFVEDIRPVLNQARVFCRTVERIMHTLPPNWEDLTPAKQSSLQHRLRALTRPLEEHAAHGEELSGPGLANLPPVQPPHTREV